MVLSHPSAVKISLTRTHHIPALSILTLIPHNHVRLPHLSLSRFIFPQFFFTVTCSQSSTINSGQGRP